MNPGILTSGYRSPPLPYGLLGNPTPVPMPGNYLHPETQDWASRVRNAGGSVSGTTLWAVDGFVQAIYNYGLRSLFYRLNLFCGDSSPSLVAARTPLFRGPSLTGAQLGNALDTSFNFVQGDYSETGGNGGLVGNGATKRLSTGLTPSALPAFATGHLATWTQGAAFSGTTAYFISAWNGDSSTRYSDAISANGRGGNWGGAGSGSFGQAGARDDGPGMFLVSRTSSTFAQYYRNGAAAGAANSTTITPVGISQPFGVFSLIQPGGASLFTNHRLRCYSIGDGMSPQQIADYYAALNRFMIAMGRV